ncbi:MAG TPA: hypothetical protein VEQ58_03510, partial [Polyangiaceae bacterium]|nr:hypothetical protein [Polyangiaceae bacterium]
MKLRWLIGAGTLSLLGACTEVVTVLDAGSGGSRAVSGGGGSGGEGGNGDSGGGDSGQGATDGGEPARGGSGSVTPELGVFVDSGNEHSCATRYGALYCWGNGADGRLGLGDERDRDAPTRVGTDSDWTSVATGVSHTCALKADGSVWCFGANGVGQLGQGSTTSSSEPLRVALPGPVTQLSSEADTACVVLESQQLLCWGRNVEGNIGLNDTHPGENQLSPIRSGSFSDWQSVATGDGHTCGIRGTGLLFGWGRNTAANLGLGQTTDQQRRSATQI